MSWTWCQILVGFRHFGRFESGGERDRLIPSRPELVGDSVLLDQVRQRENVVTTWFEKLIEALVKKDQAPPVDPKQALRDLIELGKEMGLPVISQMGGGEPAKEGWQVVAELVGENAGKLLDLFTAAQHSNLAKIRAMGDPVARRVVKLGKPELENPESRKKMIEYLDGKIGVEQTDKMLKGLGVAR